MSIPRHEKERILFDFSLGDAESEIRAKDYGRHSFLKYIELDTSLKKIQRSVPIRLEALRHGHGICPLAPATPDPPKTRASANAFHEAAAPASLKLLVPYTQHSTCPQLFLCSISLKLSSFVVCLSGKSHKHLHGSPFKPPGTCPPISASWHIHNTQAPRLHPPAIPALRRPLPSFLPRYEVLLTPASRPGLPDFRRLSNLASQANEQNGNFASRWRVLANRQTEGVIHI